MSDYKPRYRAAGREFRAWSVMQCDRWRGQHEHEPHVWNSPEMVYGPYFCPGRADGTPRTDWSEAPR